MMLDLAGTEDVSVYQSVKMMVYLSWFGVENPEICGIRKQDVSDEQNEIYLRERGKTLMLPESVMPEMREYRDAEGYYRPFHSADLTFFRYKDSPFLLRSYRKEQLSYIAVSYTHLDVYKRQEPQYVPRCPTCGSPNIRDLGPVRLRGMYPEQRIGLKQFVCNNCGYEW